MRRVEVSSHLSPHLLRILHALLDVDMALIKAAWKDCSQVGRGYFVSQVTKIQGKTRQIHHPTHHMKTLQRRILSQILYRLPVSNAAFGGVQGRSYIAAARIHLQQEGSILQLDVKDAFPSTSYADINKYLRHALKTQLWPFALDAHQRKILVGFLTHMMVVNPQGGRFPSLPLGTPTSLALFNVIWGPIDAEIKNTLHRLMPQQKIRYTRYVDDLTISSDQVLHQDTVAKIAHILHTYSYELNRSKIKSSTRQQACIHGLCWRDGYLSLPEQQILNLSKRIHQLQAFSARHPTPQEWQEASLLLQEVQLILRTIYGQGAYPQGLQIDPNLIHLIQSHTQQVPARWVEELWG
jgi:hypothetical protein